MSLRPPSAAAAAFDPIGEALRHETVGEMAATLARLTAVLETALVSLDRASQAAAMSDAGEEPRAPDRRTARRHAQACDALWNVMIQRELCGLRRHEAFLREMKVPRSVELFMGPAATASARTGGARAAGPSAPGAPG
ncbi:DUF6665 family protein [Stappia sp. ES.058]|uniref:DUF6665 family protein n=1 Tax=Stappia sp. ES.058 TaxID=1881061 RepID=UPI00087A5558|nr:DUF6665 family protein [Stappia sp. ES.058]SDU28643.1 hypothetical protein SAMN05428979_2749 [Stappia sp. ES.058]